MYSEKLKIQEQLSSLQGSLQGTASKQDRKKADKLRKRLSVLEAREQEDMADDYEHFHRESLGDCGDGEE